MGKRKEWTVRLPVATVVEAVTNKRAFHGGRLAHWRQVYAEAEERYRASLQIHESPTTGYSGHLQAVADPAAQADLGAARDKMREHEKLLGDYVAYARLLAYVTERELVCDIDDLLFLGMDRDDAPGER